MIRGMRIARPEVLWRRRAIRIRPRRSWVFPVEWLFRGRMPRAATRDSRQNTQQEQRYSGFAIGVDRTRISCGAWWRHRTACGFP